MKRTLATLLAIVTVLSCLGAVFASAEYVTRGDVDGDGKITPSDYVLVKRFITGTYMLTDAQQEAVDIDGDGAVTGTDYRLIKRHALGTYRISEELPEITEVDAAFAPDLRTSIANGVMTVTLTVGNIRDGVQMQELLAELHYDPEQLTLLTQEHEDEYDGRTYVLDCIVTLPGASWENMTKEVLDDDGNPTGLIHIDFVGIRPDENLTAETPLELQFLFELKEGVTEATVTTPSDKVKSSYAPNGGTDLTVYHGPTMDNPVEGDFRYEIVDGNAIITGYFGKGGDVVIPDTLGGAPVTAIGKLAFDDREDITSVTIPDGVKEIGYRAFWVCTGLTTVNLPGSLTTIGYEAFALCEKLASIKIPDGVSFIGDLAFYYCESLTSAHVPKSTTELGSGVFAGCNLTSLTVDPQNPVYYSDGNCIIERDTATLVQGCSAGVIPQGIKTIREYAFYACIGLTTIDIPFGVETIGRSAFAYCENLTSFTLPDSVKIIGETAFSDCIKLETVILGASVEFIGWNAFYHTGLKSIFIPISVTEMSAGVFQSCDSLTDIYCEAASQPEGWENDWVYNDGTTVHWGYKLPTPSLGDLDGDGKIDSTDCMMVKRYVLGNFTLPEELQKFADIDGNGVVDLYDYMIVKRVAMGTLVFA